MNGNLFENYQVMLVYVFPVFHNDTCTSLKSLEVWKGVIFLVTTHLKRVTFNV